MSHSLDVALATGWELGEPDLDLEPLAEALGAAGLSCRVLAWDDPGADFGSAAITVLRSTWNYPLAPREFLAWVDHTVASSALWNPPGVVRWNAHKRYLLELAAAGVPITPTELVARAAHPSFEDILDTRGWTKVVIKPAISTSSMNTFAISPGDFGRGQSHLDRLVETGDVLVQEYLPSVEAYGERALIWIDGKLTHAVRKRPRFLGDAEAISDEAVPVSPAERELALRALEAVPAQAGGPLLYARIDVAPGPKGPPVVMELELIEPSLYLSRSDEALVRMVEGIRARRKWESAAS